MNRRRFCLQKRGSQEHISLKLVNIWRCYKQKCDCHRPEVEGGSIFAPNPTQASPHKLLFHLTQLIIHTRLLKISCWYVHSQRMWDRFYNMVTPSPIAERSAVMTVSVCVCLCVCVFVCPPAYVWKYTCDLYQIFVRVIYGRGSILLWRRRDKLSTSGFMDVTGWVWGFLEI